MLNQRNLTTVRVVLQSAETQREERVDKNNSIG